MADLSKIQLSSGEECNIKDAVAREALGDLYPILVDATAIPSNADLNTYTTPGVFYASQAVAATLINTNITSVGFKMIVMKRTKNDPYLWQIKISTTENLTISFRYYYGSSWGAWKRLTPS